MYVGQAETSHTAGIVPLKTPQLHDSLSMLETLIEQHQKIATELEQRLQGLLRNEPEAAGSKAAESPTVVPLASRVNDSVQRLVSLADVYQSILRRLEI